MNTPDDITAPDYAERVAAFATFGPSIDAEAALAAAEAGQTVMSFGYGDEDFNGIEADELREAIAEDGAAAVDGYWGPFAVWTDDAPEDPNATPEDTAAFLAEPDPWAIAPLGTLRGDPDPDPDPVDVADLIARTLTPVPGVEPVAFQREQAAAILAALGRAGVEVLPPQSLEWGTCPGSESGRHYVNTGLCSGCLEYDPS